MAGRKNGLGRGLDALFPEKKSAVKEPVKKTTAKTENKTVATEKETTKDMVAAVFHDFELLINDLTHLMSVAEEEGDQGTSDLALGLKTQLEKNVWMLRSYLAD